jgi:hypothetical protein
VSELYNSLTSLKKIVKKNNITDNNVKDGVFHGSIKKIYICKIINLRSVDIAGVFQGSTEGI